MNHTLSDIWNYQPFSIGWLAVQFGGFTWRSSTPAQPPNFGVATDTMVKFVVQSFGVGLQGSFNGDLTAGSTSITSCTGITDVSPGQVVTGLGIPYGVVGPVPAGAQCSRVASVAGTTITFGNGPFIGLEGEQWVYAHPQGALATIGGEEFLTVEDMPLGTLGAIVSPDVGVTVADANGDESGTVNHRSDGSVMCNLTGEGFGTFGVTFTVPGTYTVNVLYTAASGSSFAPGSPIAPANPYAGAITITVS